MDIQEMASYSNDYGSHICKKHVLGSSLSIILGKLRQTSFVGFHFIFRIYVITSYFSYSKFANWSVACRLLTISLLIGILCPYYVLTTDPKFDPSTRMKLVLVPADAQVGSVIYRLRGTDEECDYPLIFEFVGDASSSTVKIESLPCTKYNSVCQANVVLQRRLEPGRYYDFQVSVKDTKGGMTTQLCSITATNFTTPHDQIFPHKPGIIMIPEDAKRGTELDYVIARKNPLFQKPVYLELWGSPLFAIRQKIVSSETTEGTLFLLGPLDFEKQAMYHLTILANDAYAQPGQDSRNIAGIEIIIILQDIQDQPPVFTLAPPVTKLPARILPGDKVLQVHAEDGDKGNPREVRYGLVSEGNPFTSFFDINDTSGEIFLMRPLEDIAAITHVGDPVLLTVVAEEVKVSQEEPPVMATTVQLAFFLPERTNSPPYFENDHYILRIDENSPQGSALTFVDPYVPRVYDSDPGKNGVFSLTLLNNNGTFEISPNVAERSALFLIRVRDNVMLDYEERQSVQFQILAQELGPITNLSATVNVTVYINDVNDNPPVFEQITYTVELPENMTLGTKVAEIHATDLDSGLGGKIRYTAILGYLNSSFNLDSESGLIIVSTNNHGLDREIMPEYHFYVEARDMDGAGNRAQVPLIIKITDVNDETPIFDKELYEFLLSSDLLGFTTPALIHAVDKDATAPNNEVRYEIINGNYENKFLLNKVTGELTVREKIVLRSKINMTVRNRRQTTLLNADNSNDDVHTLTVRAYDLGVPVRYSTTIVRIYPPESRKRRVTFVVPGHNPDKVKTEQTLSTITGGKVIIHDISPLKDEDYNSENVHITNSDKKNRSVVTATVLYDTSSVVDISEIQQRLSQHNSSFAIMTREMLESDTLYKAENKVLFWLLILLGTLVAITILILLLCCICSWCPLYGATTKKIVNISKTDDDIHLVHKEMANGKQTKSVQVAEWMGRREAWSAEKPSNSRTKPTRWEFHDGRQQFIESLTVHPSDMQANENEPRRSRSADNQQRNVRIKHNITAKHDPLFSLQSSRTNLINDRDIYLRDMIYQRGLVDESSQFQYDKPHRLEKLKESYLRNTDDDSIRRHEIDRGSDIDYNTARSSIKHKSEYFIKDGNVEILQLMTRDKMQDKGGEDENIYVNIPLNSAADFSHPKLLMVDNTGKEILMKRFIEEQPDGKQVIREHYQIVPGTTYIQSMPNEILSNPNIKDKQLLEKTEPTNIINTQEESAVKVIHTKIPQNDASLFDNISKQHKHTLLNSSLTQELESSLKRQNAILRQILFDKENINVCYAQNDIVLETQSLPGQYMATATQTDCEAETQTDANDDFLQHSLARPKLITVQRRACSENDDSITDEEYEFVGFSPSNNQNRVLLLKRKRLKKRLNERNNSKPRKRIIMIDEIKRKIRTPIKEEEEISEYRICTPPRKSSLTDKVCYIHKPINMKDSRYRNKKGLDRLNHDMHTDISDSPDEIVSLKQKERFKFPLEKSGFHEHSDLDIKEEDGYTDNDSDEIIIQNNISTTRLRNNSEDSRNTNGSKHHLEIHVGSFPQDEIKFQNNSAFRKKLNKSPKPNPRIYREDSIKRNQTSENNLSQQASSEPTQSKTSTPRQKGLANNAKNLSKSHEILTSNLQAYQSENEIKEYNENNRNIPKYMEWYYVKKKNPVSRSGKSLTESLKSQSTQRKSKDSEETRESKAGIHIKKEASQNDEIRHKPEPAPRKPKTESSRLLKEDIVKNKQHKPIIETNSNHPLLQHSEHRFEREGAPEVAAPPTKLPHYLYPETPPYLANSNNDQTFQNNRPKPSPIKENEIKVTNSKINLYIRDSTTNPLPTTSQSSQKQLNAANLEDDHDSGIAMSSLLNSMGRRNPIADKKSVFSIAYDDVSRVKQIPSGSQSPQC